MFCDVKLAGKEFETIHNAIWELSQIKNKDVAEQVEVIRQALQGAYEQEREISDRKYEHYNQVKKDLGLDAIWSMTEVDDLYGFHHFEGVSTLMYKDHWGDNYVSKSFRGNTWAALYVAANACIRDSGDEHHLFIEGFKQQGNTLILITGS